MTIARDAAGAEVERRLPGEVTATWAHDAAGRPAQQRILARGVVSRQRSYTWRDDLQIAAIADSHTGTTAYQHDARGHLVAARRADGSVQHRAADAVGNVYRTQDGRDRDYGRGGVLKRTPEATYVHDVDGQLTEKVTADGRQWRYAWDGTGQLREVERPDGKVVRFAYDPLGRRVKKSFEGRTTEYVWDGNDVVHELRAEGATTWVFEPGTFAPLAKVEDGRRYGVLCDHLGAPTEMRDEAGALAWRAQLDLYGVANDDVMRGGCPWRWPGQYEDEETGLYYNRFRYYDPEGGRYVSEDPIGLGGGLAQYGYVHNPLAWLDPLGLTFQGPARAATDWGHIFDRHWVEGAVAKLSGKKDVFGSLSRREIRNVVNEAWSLRKRVGTQGDRILYRAVVKNRLWSGVVEMWFNKSTKTLETAYPKGCK